jgi:hypothetical protein
MSTANYPASQFTAAVKALPWTKLLQFYLGMTFMGGSFGWAVPFAIDLFDFGHEPHGLSLLALLCTIPMMGTGTLLVLSAFKRLRADYLDPFQAEQT